jgi:hypothetical protein
MFKRNYVKRQGQGSGVTVGTKRKTGGGAGPVRKEETR